MVPGLNMVLRSLVFSPVFSVLETHMFDGNVFQQVVGLCIPSVADFTPVQFLIEVLDTHVGAQVASLDEFEVAVRTREF